MPAPANRARLGKGASCARQLPPSRTLDARTKPKPLSHLWIKSQRSFVNTRLLCHRQWIPPKNNAAISRGACSKISSWSLVVHRLPGNAGLNGDRALQLEVEDGFRLQVNLLALGSCGYSCACACACSRANCRALAATKDAAQNCSHGCAAADFGCGGLTSSVPLFGPAIARDGIALTVHRQAGQFNRQFRLTFEAAGGLYIHHAALHVSRGWDHGFAFQ